MDELHFAALERDYRRSVWRLGVGLTLLALLLLGLALTLGAYPLHGLPSNDLEWRILLELRLPRALLALLAGAVLASTGAALQNLLQNPLAEPALLGISSCAALATVAALALFTLPPWALTLIGFGGALLPTLGLVRIAARRELDSSHLLLMGIAISILANALLMWLLFFAEERLLRGYLFWMMGSLSEGAQWLQWLFAPLLLGLALLLRLGHGLHLLQLGEVQAQLLGLEVAPLRWKVVVLVALLNGLLVATTGVIGFIGLVVPHLLRLFGVVDPRTLLPLSMLGGAGLLLGADLIARTALNGSELPIGVITATLGAPIFIALLVKNQRG